MGFKPGQSGNLKGRPPKMAAMAIALRDKASGLVKIMPPDKLDIRALDLLRAVYVDDLLPLQLRIQCAVAALPFERPRLSASVSLEAKSDALASRLVQAQQRIGLLSTPSRPAANAVEYDEDGRVLRLEDLI